MDDQQERSLAWLAGIFDGEGTISAQVYTLPDGRVRITPFVCVINSDEGILEECWRLMNELCRGSKDARPRWCNKRDLGHEASFRSTLACKNIRVDGVAVRYVIQPLLPYLRSKKRSAGETLLKYLDLRRKELLLRDPMTGRIIRQGYTREQVELVASIRSHKRAKSSEAICRAPNVIDAFG